AIAVGTSEPVVINATPGLGAFQIDVTILSDDPDEGTVVLAITGRGVPNPEISVAYKTADVPSGTSVDVGRLTRFRPATLRFPITNLGTSDLELTSALVEVISGTYAEPPTATVELMTVVPQGTTDLVLQLRPG